jgi:hypothetical protein
MAHRLTAALTTSQHKCVLAPAHPMNIVVATKGCLMSSAELPPVRHHLQGTRYISKVHEIVLYVGDPETVMLDENKRPLFNMQTVILESREVQDSGADTIVRKVAQGTVQTCMSDMAHHD